MRHYRWSLLAMTLFILMIVISAAHIPEDRGGETITTITLGDEMGREMRGREMRDSITSKMKAVINPGRFGLTVIDRVFGVHRARHNQGLLLEGDLVKDQKGRVHRFAYREGDSIFVEPV